MTLLPVQNWIHAQIQAKPISSALLGHRIGKYEENEAINHEMQSPVEALRGLPSLPILEKIAAPFFQSLEPKPQIFPDSCRSHPTSDPPANQTALPLK